MSIIKVSLSRKKLQEHCTSVNVTKKLCSADSVQGELGKGNSEKMCLQPAPEGAECLWRSDAGWQAVPDARSSDEEGPVTNRRYKSMWHIWEHICVK